jgi:ferredoxin-nitrite reductase
MESLQYALNERNKKQNKIEKIKNSKDVTTVIKNLATISKNGYENLNENDSKYFLKCYGIYDKGENSFMIRVRVTAGRLNYNQAITIGELSKKFGDDYIDLTTRQQIELRYLTIENLYTTLTKLDSVGITTYQTGVDNLRNIVTDALDNISFDSVINTYPIINKLQEIFLKNDEYISVLPRKFNTAILGSGTNSCNIFGHDCCFVLASKDGEYGFNVYLGGKVGVEAQDANIFVTADTIELFFTTLLLLFKEFGFRDNRNKNRLVFLINSVGIDTFIVALKKRSNYNFKSSGINLVTNNGVTVGNKISQKDGQKATKIIIPAGITSGSDLIEFANLAKKYGTGDLRLSYDQNIFIINIPSQSYDDMFKDKIYQKYNKYQNIYFNDIIACAGTKTCNFAVIPNKKDAITMATYLNNEVPLKNGKIRMNWSACVKGCGIHGIADIGFEGAKAKDDNGVACDGVHILLGGKITLKSKEAYTLMRNIPITTASIYVKYIIGSYASLKNKNESFEEFETRVLSHYSHQALIFYCMINKLLEEYHQDKFTLQELPKTLKNETFEIFEFGCKLYKILTSKIRYTNINNFAPTFDNKLENNDIITLNNEIPPLLNDIILKMTSFNIKQRYQVFSEIIEELKNANTYR